jgi:hypothetical protein
MQEWGHVLPADILNRHERILDIDTGVVDISRVLKTGTSPIVNLAIVDKDGGGLPIGRGICMVPPALFGKENRAWS